MCESSILVNGKLFSLDEIVNFSFPFVVDYPEGKPINREDKCEAYNLGKCNVSGGYCTKYEELKKE